ncbi:AlpA family phage regulatory protein [Rhodoferax sp. GW822-FHT02A01]|uniref:helix-turn-helix transcriptional regulator n=1 Tax=Rhodoferax sp. GW822-FHT02A01 TaxID=3141537 RepID=UPI00315D2801
MAATFSSAFSICVFERIGMEMNETNFTYADGAFEILRGRTVTSEEPRTNPSDRGSLLTLKAVQPSIVVRRFIKKDEVCERTGMSTSALYDRLNPKSKRFDPEFPRQVQIGASTAANRSAVRWCAEELDAWMRLQIAKRDAELVRQDRCVHSKQIFEDASKNDPARKIGRNQSSNEQHRDGFAAGSAS